MTPLPPPASPLIDCGVVNDSNINTVFVNTYIVTSGKYNYDY